MKEKRRSDMELKRAVIMGATGAIGMALTEYLLEKQWEVILLARSSSSKIQSLKEYEEEKRKEGQALFLIQAELGELKDAQMIEKFPKEKRKIDIWFHLAWEGTFGNSRNDMDLQTRNIQYTLDAVRFANQLSCQVFVGAGSQAEYGRVAQKQKISSNTPTFPENGYGIAKLAAGQMSRILCKELGIRHEWTRILSVYGPFDGENTMVMSAVYGLLEGKYPAFSKGEQQWDYLYAKDAARALYAIAENGVDGKVYPIGSGKTKMIKEYISIIRDAIDENAQIGIGELPYAFHQVMYLCADIEELTKDTGFLPKISFEEGIKETINWCKRKREKEQ